MVLLSLVLCNILLFREFKGWWHQAVAGLLFIDYALLYMAGFTQPQVLSIVIALGIFAAMCKLFRTAIYIKPEDKHYEHNIFKWRAKNGKSAEVSRLQHN